MNLENKSKLGIFLFIIVSIIGVFSITVFASTERNKQPITATGVLREEKLTVSIPPELALISSLKNIPGSSNLTSQQAFGQQIKTYQNQANQIQDSQNQANKNQAKAIRTIPQPVGLISKIFAKPGDAVKRGDFLVEIDSELAQAYVETAQARYDLALASLNKLYSTRKDLSDKQNDLNQKESELKQKKTQAEQQFNKKYSEGQAKIAQLEQKYNQLSRNLSMAKSGLKEAEKAESNALFMLEQAKSLPDSDPRKNQMIAQANTVLQNIRQKKSELNTAIIKMSQAKTQLGNGLISAKRALSQGKAQFEQGMKKMEDVLVKINEGRSKIKEGSITVSSKIKELQKRRDQADVALSIAKRVLAATKLRAEKSGIIKNLKINEGSVVFPAQPILTIVNTKKLYLDIFVPINKISQVAIGDRVEVSVDAKPNMIFEGKVSRIGGKAEFAPSNMATKDLELLRVVKVTVKVINKDNVLKAGMPADAVIN